MNLRAAVFDMDGTLFDSGLDWFGIRERIGIPRDGRPILAQLADETPQNRERCLAILHEAERTGAENGTLISGATEILDFLRDRGVVCALLTNNSRRSAETVLRRHPLAFDLVATRDDGPMKPEAAAFTRVLHRLGVSPEDAVAIGDTHLDAVAAIGAGLAEVILIDVEDWMHAHLPQEGRIHHVADLHQARELLASWTK
jgi:HAD superfamily hydrolase (TIGR01509 family)